MRHLASMSSLDVATNTLHFNTAVWNKITQLRYEIHVLYKLKFIDEY